MTGASFAPPGRWYSQLCDSNPSSFLAHTNGVETMARVSVHGFHLSVGGKIRGHRLALRAVVGYCLDQVPVPGQERAEDPQAQVIYCSEFHNEMYPNLHLLSVNSKDRRDKANGFFRNCVRLLFYEYACAVSENGWVRLLFE